MPVVVALVLVAVFAAPAGAVVGSIPDRSVETNGEIDAVLASGNRVFIGGNFTRAGASVGGGTDLARSDGAPSYAFAKPNSTVGAIVSDGAGGWFIGGAFTRVGNVARNRLAHLLPDGSVDPAFDPNVGATVNALVRSGTTLYAAGQFTTVNGATTRNRIAAFDTTTGVATGFDPSVNGMQVMALALSGTTLYAGGGFVSVGSPAVTRNRLAAFDTTTSQPTSFDPNLSQNVAAIAISGTTLYAAGGFTSVNNGAVARNRIAAFDTTTTGAALPFDPNVNGTVGTLAPARGAPCEAATARAGTVSPVAAPRSAACRRQAAARRRARAAPADPSRRPGPKGRGPGPGVAARRTAKDAARRPAAAVVRRG